MNFKCRLCQESEVENKWDTCQDCHKEQEPHTCPYDEEINGDCESLCTCSRAQEHECAMDI